MKFQLKVEATPSFYKTAKKPSTTTRLESITHSLSLQKQRSFTIYEIFKTQSKALEFIEARSHLQLCLFSREEWPERPGVRSFIVATIDDFYSEYCKAKDRHFYELIREGQNCNLYFDLEFEYSLNKGVDSAVVLAEFKEKVVSTMHVKLDVEREDITMIELVSRSVSKFSVHLIVKVRGKIWLNNEDVGCFVKDMVHNLSNKR